MPDEGGIFPPSLHTKGQERQIFKEQTAYIVLDIQEKAGLSQ